MNRKLATELVPGQWYADRKKGSPGSVIFLRYKGEGLDLKKKYTLVFDAQIIGHDLSPANSYLLTTPGATYDFVRSWKEFYEPTALDLQYVEARTSN